MSSGRHDPLPTSYLNMQSTINNLMNTQTLHIFEPAMCCSSGVCGPDVDTQLVQFSADLEWLKSQGVTVNRYNLSQNPDIFVHEELVRAILSEKGEAALPILILNGQVTLVSRYPERTELAKILNLEATESASPSDSSCCDGSSCCS